MRLERLAGVTAAPRPRPSSGRCSARRCCAPCAGTTPSRRAWSSWPRSSGWASTRAARALPPERELADRLAVSRATLREAMAALRQAGLVQTTRGRGGGTVVTMRPPPRRPEPRPGVPPRDATRLGRRARVPPHRRARRRRAGGDRAARRRAAGAARGRARGRGHGQRAGRAPAGRLAVPPHHRGADRVPAPDRGRHRRCSRRCTRCSARSRCSRPTSPTPTPSTRGSSRRSSPAGEDRAHQVMQEHCDDTAALLRGLLG